MYYSFNINLISTANAPSPSSKTINGLISNSLISGKSITSWETLKMISLIAAISAGALPLEPSRSL